MRNDVFEDCKAYKDSGLKTPFWQSAAERWGYNTADQLRSAYRREVKRRESKGHNPDLRFVDKNESHADAQETFEMLRDGSFVSDKLIEICEQDSKSPESMLVAHGFLPDLWEVIALRNNLWHGSVKGGGNIIKYQSRINVRPKKENITIGIDHINDLFDKLEKRNWEIPVVSEKSGNVGTVLIVPIADLHLGLLGTEHTVGEVYDMEIAEKRYNYFINSVCEKASMLELDEIVFIVGNDFVNTDTISNTTTAGTQQENVTFWYELFDKSVELIISGVKSLQPHGHISVKYVPSNHDLLTMYAVMKTIDSFFKEDDTVEVDTSPLPRKYFAIGKTLFGISHNFPIKKAVELMTVEAKEHWEKCDSFVWLLAHLHTAMQYETQGLVEIYRLPTFSGTSLWSKGKGYSHKKQGQCFVVDAENGVEEIWNITV